MNRKAVAALAAVLSICAAAPAAAAPWKPVTSGKQGNSNVLGLARTADGVLHVAWRVDDAATTESLNVTPISPAGAVGSPASVVSGWSSVGDPALVTAPDGGLRIFFGGIRTTDAGDPFDGMMTATSDAAGTSWGGFANTDPRTGDYGYGRVAGATFAADGTPLTDWYDVDQTVVHRGLDPSVPVNRFTDATGGACCAILQNIATDTASGAVVAAWCQFDNSPNGIWVQGVDPATGAPSGAASRMPGTVTTFNGQNIHSCEVTQRTPLAARVGGGLYTASTTGYPSTGKVLVWRVGAASSATVGGAVKNQSLKVPALAADPNGRLWVGWLDQAGNVQARRSNRAATVWGATVTVKPPSGTVSGFALDLSAQAGTADVIGRFGSLNDLQAYATQIDPGLTLTASPASVGRGGGKVTLRVTDAGDPVPGAKVKLAGRSATTGSKGTAKLSIGPFRRKAKLTAAATKSGYVGAKAKVKVR